MLVIDNRRATTPNCSPHASEEVGVLELPIPGSYHGGTISWALVILYKVDLNSFKGTYYGQKLGNCVI